jgi:hypothetical protein
MTNKEVNNEVAFGFRVFGEIVDFLHKAFMENWGWKAQLTHSFLAVYTLRLKHDFKEVDQEDQYDHATSVIHSCFKFLAGQSPEARELASRLSSDRFSFINKSRAREYIKPYFEPTLSTIPGKEEGSGK